MGEVVRQDFFSGANEVRWESSSKDWGLCVQCGGPRNGRMNARHETKSQREGLSKERAIPMLVTRKRQNSFMIARGIICVLFCTRAAGR